MSYSADGLPKYRGQKSRCDWCEEVFRSGDMVLVAPLGFVFCGNASHGELHCANLWRKKSLISELDFEVMEFYKNRDHRSGGLSTV